MFPLGASWAPISTSIHSDLQRDQNRCLTAWTTSATAFREPSARICRKGGGGRGTTEDGRGRGVGSAGTAPLWGSPSSPSALCLPSALLAVSLCISCPSILPELNSSGKDWSSPVTGCSEWMPEASAPPPPPPGPPRSCPPFPPQLLPPGKLPPRLSLVLLQLWALSCEGYGDKWSWGRHLCAPRKHFH
jgi:hypothetical protein